MLCPRQGVRLLVQPVELGHRLRVGVDYSHTEIHELLLDEMNQLDKVQFKSIYQYF